MSILNIVELQNVITSATGVTPVTFLSNQVINMQQMVRYDIKQINTNSISNFDTSPIQVYSPLNLSNVAITSNGDAYGAGSSNVVGTTSTGVLSLGYGGGTGLVFQQGNISTFYINSSSNAVFYGSVTASNFITASDAQYKTKVATITDYETVLSSIRGVRFQWTESGQDDVGVLAQEVLPVLPEAVEGVEGSYKVSYMKLIPVLIEAVKSLQARVQILEKGFNSR